MTRETAFTNPKGCCSNLTILTSYQKLNFFYELWLQKFSLFMPYGCLSSWIWTQTVDAVYVKKILNFGAHNNVPIVLYNGQSVGSAVNKYDSFLIIVRRYRQLTRWGCSQLHNIELVHPLYLFFLEKGVSVYMSMLRGCFYKIQVLYSTVRWWYTSCPILWLSRLVWLPVDSLVGSHDERERAGRQMDAMRRL